MTADRITRRRFVAGLAAAAVGPFAAAHLTGCSANGGASSSPVADRASRAYEIRREAALRHLRGRRGAQATNGDEHRYPSHIASYSKALPHDSLGEVDPDAYRTFVRAVTSGDPARIERVPMGGTVPLANPAAAFAYDLEGPDAHELTMPAPPAFASAAAAREMAEVYWQAVTRDVPFERFGEDPAVARAVVDLERLGVSATPDSVFRGPTKGDLQGPYVSQFLLKDVPMGVMKMSQRFAHPLPVDFLTTHDGAVASQNGAPPAGALAFETVARHVHSPRSISEYVRRDYPYEAFLNACAIILGFGPKVTDPSNPYRSMQHQSGFVTMGGPQVFDDLARVSNLGLKAAWYQKWVVHRRLRPEAFAIRVHCRMTGAADYPVHQSLLDSDALASVFSATGAYALPMAYPDGSPTHPSYPAGHAVIAGACATVLKAFFDESMPVPQPVVAAADGLSLKAYEGQLTIGGELDKLASNVTLARDTAGVHYRSDGIEGMRLGERLALSVLRERKSLCPEQYGGFSLHTFDGRLVTV